MAASMHAQLCMPCNHMTAGCSLMAPAAHSLTRALGTAGSGRSRKGRKVCRAIATPGYSVGSEDAGFSYEIPSLTEEGLGLGQSLSLSCSLEGEGESLCVRVVITRMPKAMRFSSFRVLPVPNLRSRVHPPAREWVAAWV